MKTFAIYWTCIAFHSNKPLNGISHAYGKNQRQAEKSFLASFDYSVIHSLAIEKVVGVL